MEQFKQLKWSWHKYEEEKKILPRNFSFETISDNDPLSRNLNEIHTCVLPEQTEYRIFKTTEELAANHFELDNFGHVVDMKDPRKVTYSKLEPSSELIKNYSYSSELKKEEQIKILSALKDDKTIHNKRLLKISKDIEKSQAEIPKELQEKWQKEIEHFERCAEIFFHRHITQLNNLLCDSFKDLLMDKWMRQEVQFPHVSYQAITMILRNSGAKNIVPTLTHVESTPHSFKPEFYVISDLFPNLTKIHVDTVKLCLQHRNLTLNNSELDADIHISLDVLTKLFVDGTEFNTIFVNENNSSRFIFNETVPLKKVTQNDALEEAVRIILKFNVEWNNANKRDVQISNSQNKIDFKLRSINETMSKVFKSYKNHAGANNEISLWKLQAASQTLSIRLSHTNCCFVDQQTKAIFSVKFEYQTTFGAEKMTKEELLKEWIQIKFSTDSVVLRYRVDVKSLEILSVAKLTIADIESELKELYCYDPVEALSTLANVLNCIHNLPDSTYLIQAQRNESDVSKLLIYKDTLDNGKNIVTDEDFQVTFSRKWIPIDKRVCTFLHLNEEISPCSFPYKSTSRVSYIMPKAVKKAATVSAPVKEKKVKLSPKKQQVLRKSTRSKKKKSAKKKVTVAKSLK